MTTWTLTTTLKLVTEDCCRCGIAFAMPNEFQQQRLADRGTFYCPNGHGQAYTGPTDAEKLRLALAREQAVKDQLEASERSRRALKGRATRLRNQVERAENGVCPHCNRSFQDLRRHMASKHGGEF